MKLFLIVMMSVSSLFAVVDINTASKSELSSLNGIGMKKADAIIEYRNSNCFKTVKELEKVHGIGSKTIEKNIDNLITSKCRK